jgi:hypothetical protein
MHQNAIAVGRFDPNGNGATATAANSSQEPSLTSRLFGVCCIIPARELPAFEAESRQAVLSQQIRRQRMWLLMRHTSNSLPVAATLFGTLMMAFNKVVNFSISTDCALAAKIISLLCICTRDAKK